jgi:hypothetical protein
MDELEDGRETFVDVAGLLRQTLKRVAAIA